MTPPPSDNRDPSGYADGDPDAVRAARPPEPSEAQWEEIRLRIQARVAARGEPARPSGTYRYAPWGAVAALATAAAAAAWLVFGTPAPKPPGTPEIAEVKPAPPADPLAEFDVLPMASEDEVVLHRVPGDGWLPVGAHPLPGELALATAEEVALEDPDPSWPTVAPTPKHAPMIFATKPR